MVRDLHCTADVSEVIEVKRAALRCHKTQMERPANDADWPILSDVADGEWLDCFFTGEELFYRHVVSPAVHERRGHEDD
jgi:LmbE family N-acetylglucosaminyl deacetylase